MKQYYSIKEVHHDAILLFRVGDFYETFGSDAIKASRILGITLTRRANGAASFVELAGFPYHALDTYLPKLVRAGERVAVCDQLEDPKKTKKIVKRGVTELVTPGVTFNSNILEHKENTFLASVFFGKGKTGVAFLDLSTGEFDTAEGDNAYIDKLLANYSPREVLYQRGYEEMFREAFGTRYYTYKLDEWVFSLNSSREKLLKQFECTSLKGFGIENMTCSIVAAGAILYYLDFTEHKNTRHINSIARIDEDRYVWIDKFSIRNLELFQASGGEGRSLCDVLDKTISPMGGRMMRRWISLPLKDPQQINARLDCVEALVGNAALREEITEAVASMGDMERIMSRVAAGRVTPREVVQLKTALYGVEKLKKALNDSGHPQLAALASKLDPCPEVRDRIEKEVFPDPSNQIQKGGVIADGVNIELDDLRNIASHGKEIIAGIQHRESETTGIPSLKVSFNNVFGYYIEVRNTHKDKVPAEWIRKQTLANAERYITAELKEYEDKILGAEERILAIEQTLYEALLEKLSEHTHTVQADAAVVARIDCLLSFASAAIEHKYCRPELNDGYAIDIKGGRHPVIETLMKVGEEYVANDVFLDGDSQQIIIITGPNMSGKSALLRQTALIVLMAQIGCYVPADKAEIGIIDKIFTRVGASDNISQGESTFMVEMLESASILNNITGRSLILLDEIGRGTSTYDGISIAWAMVEYIHNHPRGRAKTLFATHYHELNDMAQTFERIRNYNVSVAEVDNKVIFLRKLMSGGTEHSFGIHVAKMAGMPAGVISRANEILQDLESSRRGDMSYMTLTHSSMSYGTLGETAEMIYTSEHSDEEKTAGGKPSTKQKGSRAASRNSRNKDYATGDNIPSDGKQASENRSAADMSHNKVDAERSSQTVSNGGMQLSIFQLDDPVLSQIRDEIRDLDINSLTPLEALNKLNEIKKITGI